MAAVPEDQRVAALRRLGASAPLIRLACGECVHEQFRDTCLGPPHFVYHGAGAPDGPPLVPLWDCNLNDAVVGVWEQPGGPEFIEFSIEADEECTPLARTEQGLWATQFDFYYECDAPVERLQEAAAAVRYRFLDRHLAARAAADGRLGTFEAHRAWLLEFVAGIDRDSGAIAAPGAAADRGGP
jgi:hypothetical protein